MRTPERAAPAVSRRVRSTRRARVGVRDLHGFVSELESRGATGIRRRPARFDGWVRVTWVDPEAARPGVHHFTHDVRPWVPAYALGAAFFAFVVVVFGIIQIFGGGLG